MSQSSAPLTQIAIAVITKARPDMLAVLLSSYAELDCPEGCVFEFIIVENDEIAHLGHVISEFETKTQSTVIYAQEPNTGIPYARNAALQIALDRGGDFLLFADDDERVPPQWAAELIATVQAQNLDLVGGPLRIEGEVTLSDPWQIAVLTFLQMKAAKTEAKRQKKTVIGQNHPYEIYTNNWGVRLDFLRQTGLKFDTTLRFTGGSDTALSLAIRKAGGAIGWASTTHVFDRIPQHRLTLAYHYARTRDQARNGVLLRRKAVWKLPFFALQRGVEAALALLSFPFLGRAAVVKAVNKVAQISGRVRGSLGQESALYKDIK